MNVTPARRRPWSPQAIFFTVLFHGIILYLVASSFRLVPPLLAPQPEPAPIQILNYSPPQPTVEPDPVIETKPIFRQREPTPSPVAPTVPPSPLSSSPPSSDPGPATVMVGTQVGEEPVTRGLPEYPKAAQRDDKEGVVTLSITIMPDGSVRDVQVVNARPRGYFEDAAIRSVQTWRYAPSNMIRKNVIVRMDFVLRG